MPKAIQDRNRLYDILSPLVQFGCRCHYRHFVVRGTEHLPSDGAYIIAPCHQQALMEPLAVLNFAPKAPVFLARADIFAKPTLRRILTFLRIMPVYRIRDGKDQLGRNKEVFDRCREVLLDGYPLCLMAEGRHNNRHHLLNMGKGMFRIAGETQRMLGSHPLYIVPTGIDYDDYERPYSDVVVNIGKPIAVLPFRELYTADEPQALNQMRETLAEALSPLMVDIRSEEHYDGIWSLCNLLNGEVRRRQGLGNSAWNRYAVRQQIARRLDALARDDSARFARLMADNGTLRGRLRRLHLDERTLSDHWSLPVTLLALLAVVLFLAAIFLLSSACHWLLPVLFFCLLCHPFPLIPTHLVIRRMIADSQFRSSVNFGVRFFLSIIYTIVIGVVMVCCRGGWMASVADLGAWWGLVAVVVAHLEARLAGTVVGFFRDFYDSCRYWLLRQRVDLPDGVSKRKKHAEEILDD